MKGHTCPRCGNYYQDTIPGYPLGKCLDCIVAEQDAHYRTLPQASDSGYCGHCGGWFYKGVREHERDCSFGVKDEQIQAYMKRIHA